MARPAAVLNILVRANTGGASASLTRLDRRLKGTSRTANTSMARIASAAKYGGLAIAGVGAVSTKLAIDFERSMRNVNSLAKLPEPAFKKLNDRVLDLAGKTAQAPKTLADGLYDLVSSGFDANDSIKILHKSAIAATAGLTDTATATKGVAAVLNAYHEGADKAGKVSDTLFQTVNYGVLTFDDLATTIGDTLPFAASLGVKLNEVGAATATMTKQGLSSSETMTRIRNVMQTLIKPGVALKATFDDLNTTGEDMIKQYGFQGALEKLVATTDGSKEAVAKLFPNIRALGGALALTGDNASSAESDLKKMSDTTGATAKVFHEQSKSFAVMWQQFTADAEAAGIRLGQKIIPELKDLLDVITNPKLTLDQKVSAITDKLGDAVQAVVPTLAKIGVKGAEAFVKGMLNAGIWGHLVLGGLLFKAMGGLGAFRGLGSRAGKGFGMSFGSAAGPIAATIITSALAGADFARSDFGKANVEHITDVAHNIADALDIPLKKAQDVVDFMHAHPGLSADTALSQMKQETRSATRDVASDIDTMRQTWGDSISDIRHETQQRMQQIESLLGSHSARGTQLVIKNFNAAISAIKNSMKSGEVSTAQGMAAIEKLLVNKLRTFGIKDPEAFIARDAAVRDPHHVGGLQSGGAIVPGAGPGDKVPLHIGGRLTAMVEPGELVSVANRNATAALMQANRAVPRFQKGGVAGSMSAMIAEANRFEAQHFPYVLGGGHGSFGVQPVDCSGFVSDVLHAAGLLNTPMVSGALMNWGKPASGSEPLVVYANPAHTVMSLNGKFAGTSGSNPGGGAGWIEGGFPASYLSNFAARTMDVAGGALAAGEKIKLPRYSSDFGLGELVSTGINNATSAIEAKVNRQLAAIGGGGTLGGGQPAADLPRSLQRFNHLWAPHQAPDYGGPTMPVDKIAELAEWAGAPGVTMAQIAHGESGYRPGSWGVDPNGVTKGYGLWAITTGVGNDAMINDLGGPNQMFNPVTNAEAMKRIYDSSGIGAWYGTRYLTDSNAHYSGPMNQRGGIVAKLAKGGLLDLDHFASQIMGSSGPGERRSIIAAVRDKITAATTFGNLTADGGALAGSLQKLREQADLYADNATFAQGLDTTADLTIPDSAKGTTPAELLAGLTVTNPFTGKPLTMDQLLAGIGDQDIAAGDTVNVDIPGMFQGFDQAGWLTKELDPLWTLRNQLIVTDTNVSTSKRGIAAIVAEIKGPGGMLAKVAERIKEINQRIRQLETERKRLERKLHHHETQREQIKSDLAKELGKPKKKQDHNKINKLQTDLAKNGAETESLKRALGKNHNMHKRQEESLGRQSNLRDSLKNINDGVLSNRSTALSDGDATLLDALTTVQGSGVTQELMDVLPGLGTFKGDIGSVQTALRDLGAKMPTIRAEEAQTPDVMHIQDLINFADAVRFGAFNSQPPYMGAFAKGGVAWVGEKGPEPVFMPNGTRVVSHRDAVDSLAPNVQINFAPGMEWLAQFMDVRIDGKIQKADRAKDGARRAGVALAA